MFQIGLNSTSNRFTVPAAFLTWGWAYAYLMLSSRTPKQWYGLDHQGSPREDLAKYGEAAVRDGKLTRTQLGRIQRLEAASANSIDGYAFFGLSVIFATVAEVPTTSIASACSVYSIARVAYGLIYVFVEDDWWSQIRGLIWWTCNASCLYLVWAGTRNSSN
ncbi:unnamed protein product [Clonostachys rosea]|uniref:Uncharacterized protein n=1 Tax=Bionectria ochroleuca TaxID=29856 RepID=A0ABY6UEE9_BIOOC|nr:unnamed protein product [Clonostachys rosea]